MRTHLLNRLSSRTVIGTLALGLGLGLGLAPSARAVAGPTIVVTGTSLSDNGDDDGWADTRETVTLRLALRNLTGVDLTGVYAVLSTGDPEIACVTRSLIPIGSLAADATLLTESGFEFTVADVQRSGLDQDLSADLQVEFFSDALGIPLPVPQTLSLDLDLDAAGGSSPTTYFEGFESGFGAFTTMHLDETLNPPDADLFNHQQGVANATGSRCQYSNPFWEAAAPFGSSQGRICYPNPNGAADAYYFGVTADRAYSGTASLYFGIYLNPADGFTTPNSQLEAIRTTHPVNLGWERTCSESPVACVTDVDCPGVETCAPVSPTLSFKHQVSFMDHRSLGSQPGRAADRGIVQMQVVDTAGQIVSDWIKLRPFVNVYDTQANSNYFNCMFDPADDGNTENDFFDPSDPLRTLGPSSTCAPEFNFTDQGDTGNDFDPADWGDASHGPGLEGDTGRGTWIEPQISLDRYRGRRIRLRFLATGMKLNTNIHWEQAFGFNPDPGDDGWFIDDVTVTHALQLPAAISVDTKDNSLLPEPEDDDLDGLACDNCPVDPNPEQEDADGDGVGDVCDACPLETVDDRDADGLCCPADNCCEVDNPGQEDQDGDGVGDACDNCPTVPNADQRDDIHPNGVGDACDDPDGDGLSDADDVCPDVGGADQTDTDGDGRGDVCDNCPAVASQDQDDADADGVGDVCDTCPFVSNVGDADLDGVDDACDVCLGVVDPGQADADADGLGDACDLCPALPGDGLPDTDGDGIGDACDACPDGPATDTDGDGVPCGQDNCPGLSNPLQLDADLDGIGLGCDACPDDPGNDADGDGVCGDLDNCASAPNPRQEGGVTLFTGDISRFAITADGERVVLRARGGAPEYRQRLLSAPLSGGPATLLAPPPGAQGHVDLFATTPDGKTAFYTVDAYLPGRKKLYRVPVAGGSPVEVGSPGDESRVGRFQLSSDGTRIVYETERETGTTAALYTVATAGGRSARLTAPFRPDGDIATFAISDDGSHVVYTADQNRAGVDELYAIPTGGGSAVRLNPPLSAAQSVSRPQIASGGRTVVFLANTEGAFHADDLFSVAVEGGPVTLLSGGDRVAAFSIAPDGLTVVYLTLEGRLRSVPIAGGPSTLLSDLDDIFFFPISPDGSTVVFTASGQLHSVPIGGGVVTPLGGPPSFGEMRITPDGTTVVFAAAPDGSNSELFAVPIDGGVPLTLNDPLAEEEDVFTPVEIAPDSASVVYRRDFISGGSFAGFDLLRVAIDAEPDPDGDGVLIFCDVCPGVADPTQTDGDGDGHGAACDCDDDAPATYPGAVEVNDGVDNQCPGDAGFGSIDEVGDSARFGPPGDKDLFYWEPQAGATGYGVARSASADFSGPCNTWPTPDPGLSDPQQPGPGATWYYLVRAVAPNLGSWGTDGAGQARSPMCP